MGDGFVYPVGYTINYGFRQTASEKKQIMDHRARSIHPFWPPAVAGLALGLVLLMTFVLTGHGLGATGFTTRLVAWFGWVRIG